ncbi:hypothetical protein D3C81_1574440 [compost metagenome]
MCAEIEEAECGNIQDRHRQRSGKFSNQHRHNIGHHGIPQDLQRRGTVETHRDYVFFFQFVMYCAVDSAHHAWQQRQPNGQHGVFELGPEERHHHNRQQQRRDGEQGVENMIEHRRAKTTGYAGKYPEDHPDNGCGHGDQQCGAVSSGGTGQQTAENIAAEVVSAQEEGNVAIT